MMPDSSESMSSLAAAKLVSNTCDSQGDCGVLNFYSLFLKYSLSRFIGYDFFTVQHFKEFGKRFVKIRFFLLSLWFLYSTLLYCLSQSFWRIAVKNNSQTLFLSFSSEPNICLDVKTFELIRTKGKISFQYWLFERRHQAALKSLDFVRRFQNCSPLSKVLN